MLFQGLTISGIAGHPNSRNKSRSVFKYDIVEVDSQKLIEFMDEGIGERRVEGFGRFIIIDSLTDGIFERVKRKKKKICYP